MGNKPRLIASSPRLERALANLLNSGSRSHTDIRPPAHPTQSYRHPERAVNCNSRIRFFNNSEKKILRFHPVGFTGAFMPQASEIQNARYQGNAIAIGEPAKSSSLIWGISEENVEPGSFGSAIVSGVTPAFFSGEGKFVAPGDGVLVASNSGNGQILLSPEGEAPGIINLGGGGSAGQVPHQFTVTDSSTYNEDGTVKQLQVTVSEGVLNDVTYPSTDVPLTVGIAKFWIYAIDGKFYALNHEFQSDYFSVLLCGTVEVADGKLSITQVNYRDYPYVPVCGSEYGAVTLAGTVSYASHVLTANYTVAVKGLLNNNALNFPATAIPVAGNGTLLAYIKLLTVGNDVTPESGFEFSGTGQPSQTVEWHQVMFRYTLTANTFKVLFRQHPLQMFTFTRIYLNASESGA